MFPSTYESGLWLTQGVLKGRGNHSRSCFRYRELSRNNGPLFCVIEQQGSGWTNPSHNVFRFTKDEGFWVKIPEGKNVSKGQW